MHRRDECKYREFIITDYSILMIKMTVLCSHLFFVDINSSYGLGNYSNLKESEGGYNTHEKEV